MTWKLIEPAQLDVLRSKYNAAFVEQAQFALALLEEALWEGLTTPPSASLWYEVPTPAHYPSPAVAVEQLYPYYIGFLAHDEELEDMSGGKITGLTNNYQATRDVITILRAKYIETASQLLPRNRVDDVPGLDVILQNSHKIAAVASAYAVDFHESVAQVASALADLLAHRDEQDKAALFVLADTNVIDFKAAVAAIREDAATERVEVISAPDAASLAGLIKRWEERQG